MQSQPSPRTTTVSKVSRFMLRLDRHEWSVAAKECGIASSGYAVGKMYLSTTECRGLVGFVTDLKYCKDFKINDMDFGVSDCIVAFTTESPHRVAHKIAKAVQSRLHPGERITVLATSLNESNDWFGIAVTKSSKNPVEGFTISSVDQEGEVIFTRNRRRENQTIGAKLSDCGVAIFGLDEGIALPLARCLVAGRVKHLRLFDNRVVNKNMLGQASLYYPLAKGRARVEYIAKLLIQDNREKPISYMPESAWEIVNQNRHIGLNSLLFCCDGSPSDREAVVELALKYYLVPLIDIHVYSDDRREDVITADVRFLMPGTACDECLVRMMQGEWKSASVTVTKVNLEKMSRTTPDYLTTAKDRIQKAAVSVALQYWYEMINGDLHESRWTRLEIVLGEESMLKLDMVGQEKSGDCGNCNFTAA